MTIAKKSRIEAKRKRAIEAPWRLSPALASAGVRPAKSRGQNFLTSATVAERIVAAGQIDANEDVIEIGPGLGILTEKIAARPHRRITLIELDSRLAERLLERFDADDSVQIINVDFLEADLATIIERPPIKVIGNLPFNVAAAILRRLSDNSRQISRMVLMFQREVAARIRARPGDDSYSALSVYTALYWEIDLHFAVAAGSFHPRPKVDAEVLGFRPHPIESRPFATDEEQPVLQVVRAAFSAPRKTIRNALGHALGLEAAKIGSALEESRIDPIARAETLCVADFVRLAKTLAGELKSKLVVRDE